MAASNPSSLARRLFRFTAVRPIQPRAQNSPKLDYRGDFSPFLTQLKRAEGPEAVGRLAQAHVDKAAFFRAERLESTAYWPLISGMARLYSGKMDRSVPLSAAIAKAFTASTDTKEIQRLVEDEKAIWDDYVASVIVASVTEPWQGALVDSLRACEIASRRETIDTAPELQAQLVKSPALPPWLVEKMTGKLRRKFPYVIGVADLMVVNEQWESYDRAEISHIENVMATEARVSLRRQLDRTETTTTFESERSEETVNESTSSMHSALAQEVSTTIANQSNISTGTTVSTSYGPAVSVDAGASFDFSTSSEQSTSSAQEYAQDLVERAVATVSSREFSGTVSTVLSENEASHEQSFENKAAGATHVIGVYRHVDQIWRAQVFNYGRRLMLDIVVPEPSQNFLLSREDGAQPKLQLKEPPEFTFSAKDVTRGNYQSKALEWGASDVPAPPDAKITVTSAIEISIPKFGTDEATSVSMAKGQIQVPEGYSGTSAQINFFGDSKKENDPLKDHAKVLFYGSEWSVGSTGATVPLSDLTGAAEYAVYIDNFEGGVVSVRVECDVSNKTFEKWQNDVYAALKSANQRAWDTYNAAKSNSDALASVKQETLHPDIKRQIELTELKRAAIAMLSEDNFENSGSVEVVREDGVKFPEIDFPEAKREGRHARFMEEAFEWEELTWLYYPYFWARRGQWYKLMNQADIDYNFNAFLQSGAARVNLAIRPGFEAAVLWFMATGQVWGGGPTPMVNDPLYVALIDEIVESKGRNLDNPKPVGESWTYSVPTGLVVLDPDDRMVPPPDPV